MTDKVNLIEKFALFSEQWTPKIVGRVADHLVKLAKLEGEFVWHAHDAEDEMFLVVKGELHMQFRDRTVTVMPGEFIVVPAGIEHNPFAPVETYVVLFERATTAHTGSTVTDRTVTEQETI